MTSRPALIAGAFVQSGRDYRWPRLFARIEALARGAADPWADLRRAMKATGEHLKQIRSKT